MKIAIQDGIDYRKGLIVGVSFWLGVGFQNDMVFPDLVRGIRRRPLPERGHDRGIAAILMTLSWSYDGSRRSRIEGAFDLAVLPRFREFLAGFAARSGWDDAMAARLDAACEETLLTLVARRRRRANAAAWRLPAHREGNGARCIEEFVVTFPGGQHPGPAALLADDPGDATPAEQEGSLRLCAASPPPSAISSITARNRHRPGGRAGTGPNKKMIPMRTGLRRIRYAAHASERDIIRLPSS